MKHRLSLPVLRFIWMVVKIGSYTPGGIVLPKAAADESPTFTSDLELYRGKDGDGDEDLSFTEALVIVRT